MVPMALVKTIPILGWRKEKEKGTFGYL